MCSAGVATQEFHTCGEPDHIPLLNSDVGISKYILPGKDPEPFDVSVHLASSTGEIIQTWKYSTCSVTKYVTFFIDNLLFFKFKQTFGSEIRDKTTFDCTGLEFDLNSEMEMMPII